MQKMSLAMHSTLYLCKSRLTLGGIALFGLQTEENENSEDDMKVFHIAPDVAH